MVRFDSTFGFKSFFRFIANIVIPGTGTISLLCQYGFNCGIFRIAIIKFIIGQIFFISIISMFFHNDAFFNFIFIIGLNFYISGIFNLGFLIIFMMLIVGKMKFQDFQVLF